MTPCEASIVAHFFSDDSNQLASVVLTTALTLTRKTCAAAVIDLDDTQIGPSECLILAAIIGSPSSAAATTLILSQVMARERRCLSGTARCLPRPFVDLPRPPRTAFH